MESCGGSVIIHRASVSFHVTIRSVIVRICHQSSASLAVGLSIAGHASFSSAPHDVRHVRDEERDARHVNSKRCSFARRLCLGKAYFSCNRDSV